MNIVCRWVILFCTILAVNSFGQQTAVEYFIDADPGVGNGVPAGAFTEASALDINISLSDVTTGYHKVYFRAKDAEGIWSHTSSHAFFVQRTPTGVSYAEYFIDEDPGYGNASPITSLQNGTAEFIIPLMTVDPGFHRLAFRSRDDEGSWSVTASHIFYATHSDGQANINAIQYYFENGNDRSATLTYPIISPAPLIDAEFIADLSSLPGNKEYTMYFWAINSNGVNSPVYTKKVKVCNDLPTTAAFDYIGMGTSVSFIDSSANAVEYRWDFGDGTTSTVSNPVHNYNAPGRYEVSLIASNFCNPDTIRRIVDVIEVQNFFPRLGGNTGSVEVTFAGGGFSEQTKVSLLLNGEAIDGIDIYSSEDGKSLSVTFELYDAPLGLWDVVIESSSNNIKIPGAFSVAVGSSPRIVAAIEGRDVIRQNRAEKITFKFSNDGNIDAKGVPIWFAVPRGTKVELNFDVLAFENTDKINYDTLDFYVEEDSLFGKPDKVDIYGFILRSIPASASVSYSAKITMSEDGDIYTWTGSPLYGSPLRPEVPECFQDIFEITMKKLLEELGQEAVDWILSHAKCFSDVTFRVGELVFDNVDAAAEEYGVYKNGSQAERVLLAGKVTKNLVISTAHWANETYVNCYEVIFEKKAPDYKKKFLRKHVPRKILKNLARASGILTVITVAYDVYDLGSTIWAKSPACRQVVQGSQVYQKFVRAVASFDPNQKVGVHGATIENFVQGNSSLFYKIYFENLSSASAPAQEIIIVDTLDNKMFELASFRLAEYEFGNNSSVSVPRGLSEYFTDIDLRPTKNMLVRVNAKLDTVSGILVWRFISIDPATGELIDDPLDGFLPPNQNSPEGEGFVSFTIQPKMSLPFGTRIENKATIYFDANAPIETNTFVNTIDRTSPTSGVLPLTATLRDSVFTVNWGGTDQGSGVRSYDVYYAVNGSPFRLWQYDVVATESIFHGKKDSLYSFYSIAKDYAGNIENAKQSGEASTQIITAVEFEGKIIPLVIYPNPFRQETTLEFQIQQPAYIKMTIKNAQGQNVIKIREARYVQGKHRVTVNTADLHQGFYLCEFVVDDKTYTSKLIKL